MIKKSRVYFGQAQGLFLFLLFSFCRTLLFSGLISLTFSFSLFSFLFLTLFLCSLISLTFSLLFSSLISHSFTLWNLLCFDISHSFPLSLFLFQILFSYITLSALICFSLSWSDVPQKVVTFFSIDVHILLTSWASRIQVVVVIASKITCKERGIEFWVNWLSNIPIPIPSLTRSFCLLPHIESIGRVSVIPL